MQKIIFNIILLVSIIVLTKNSFAQKNYNEIKTIVIDAGHGGKDPGASGTLSKEKFITLNIALKLGYYININYPDINVIFTRNEDKFIPLKERCEIANKNKADLFISIHANASYNSKIHGTETYTLGLHKTKENLDVAMKENSVILFEDNYSKKYNGFDPNKATSYIIFNLMQGVTIDKSLVLAENVEHEFKTTNNRHSRGVRQAGFWVLKGATMPSVLIETGFITNKAEEKYLCSENGQDNIAASIFKAIKRYKEHKDSDTVNSTKYIAEKQIQKKTYSPPVKEKTKTIKERKKKEETPIKEERKKEPIVETKKEIKKIEKKEISKKLVKKDIKTKKKILIKKEIKKTESKQVSKKEIKKKLETPIKKEIKKTNTTEQAIYGVQIRSALQELAIHKGVYKELGDIHMYKSKNVFKYYIGKTTNLKEAVRLQNQTRLLIKDCFVIALYKGKRITIKESLKIIIEK